MVDLLIVRAGMLMLTVAVACAHGDTRDAPPRPPDTGATEARAAPPPTAEPPSAPRVASEDRGHATDPGYGTPAREASLKIIEEGKGLLIAGQPAEAGRRFDHATRIDPTNGFAYYYLGRARIEAGHAELAIGVLEKAEALLGPYPGWRDAARRLRETIR